MTGQELIDRMVAFIRLYVACSEGQALTCALWCLNTWTYERFAAVPYLEIWGTGVRCGKSSLASVLKNMCQGGYVLATYTGVGIARAVDALEGAYTPILDEAEKLGLPTLGKDKSILATGYQKGAVHPVTVGGKVIFYRTYCPKAFASIGNLTNVLRERSISIKLNRDKPIGNWTLGRLIGESEAAAIMEAWQVIRTPLMEFGAPPIQIVDPDWLESSRDREIWSPLFSLAHALRCNRATVSLLTRTSIDLSEAKLLPPVKYHPEADIRVEDNVDASTACLRDIVASVRDGETFIPTVEMLKRLHDIETSPWRVWRGEGLDDRNLPSLLNRFGLTSETGQIGKGRPKPDGTGRKACKGFYVKDIRKAAKG